MKTTPCFHQAATANVFNKPVLLDSHGLLQLASVNACRQRLIAPRTTPLTLQAAIANVFNKHVNRVYTGLIQLASAKIQPQ